MNYPQALRFLNSLVNYEQFPKDSYDFDLAGYREFLKTLGSPEQRLKNVILVAGTKGKGSTCAFIESSLRTCGFKTGLYASPHLLSIRERIKVSGADMNKTTFARLVSRLAPAIKKFKGRPVTYFEALTAVAFLYFDECKTDYTILEVGLGGRLDATNVTDPIISVITRIGFDHTTILGDTLTKIASEKAGIIHDRSLVVCAPQEAAIINVIQTRCFETRSRLIMVENESHIEFQSLGTSGCIFVAQGVLGKRWFSIPLLGSHQITNGRTALVVLSKLIGQIKQQLQEPESETVWKKIALGLSRTELHGRCEIIKKRPLILLDTCHNPDSAQALKEVIATIFQGRPVVLILGLSSDKPIKAILNTLLPLSRLTFLTQAENPRALPVKDLVVHARDLGYRAKTTDALKPAINQALVRLKPDDILVITGSFFIAGEALVFFGKRKLDA